jgi:hypothetical protein
MPQVQSEVSEAIQKQECGGSFVEVSNDRQIVRDELENPQTGIHQIKKRQKPHQCNEE